MIELADHNLPLRKACGVSEVCMNAVYDILRNTDRQVLVEMWREADRWTPEGLLIRHQIAFTIERLDSGRWQPDPRSDQCSDG